MYLGHVFCKDGFGPMRVSGYQQRETLLIEDEPQVFRFHNFTHIDNAGSLTSFSYLWVT